MDEIPRKEAKAPNQTSGYTTYVVTKVDNVDNDDGKGVEKEVEIRQGLGSRRRDETRGAQLSLASFLFTCPDVNTPEMRKIIEKSKECFFAQALVSIGFVDDGLTPRLASVVTRSSGFVTD